MSNTELEKTKKKESSLSRRNIIILGLLGFIFVHLVIAVTFVTFLKNPVAASFNRVATEIAFNNPTQTNLDLWSFSVRNDWFRNYLIDSGVDSELISFQAEGDYEDSLEVMNTITERYGDKLGVYIVDHSTDPFSEVLGRSVEVKKDPKLLVGQSYTIEGVTGEIIHMVESVSKVGEERVERKVLADVITEYIDEVSDLKFDGELPLGSFKTQIINLAFDLQTENITKDQITIEKFDQAEESGNLLAGNQRKITIGRVQLNFTGCFFYAASDVLYDIQKQAYEFADPEAITAKGCTATPVSDGNVIVADCSDCYLFPVDKTHALPSSYTPEVESLSEFDSNTFLSPEALEDFRELYAAAVDAGHSVNITSAYRSFEDQATIFQYLVEQSLPFVGWDTPAAESQANTFSARPGFSEHQLGTTVDLNSSECSSFDGFCAENNSFWGWLSVNAWKYGFVLSYPEGKQNVTGYIYEPWHYRWIGRDLAREFAGQEKTLNVWLRER